MSEVTFKASGGTNPLDHVIAEQRLGPDTECSTVAIAGGPNDGHLVALVFDSAGPAFSEHIAALLTELLRAAPEDNVSRHVIDVTPPGGGMANLDAWADEEEGPDK